MRQEKKKGLSNTYHAYIQGSNFRVRLLERRHLSLSGPNNCCGSSSSNVLLLKMCKMIQKCRYYYVTYSVLMDFELASMVHYVLKINTQATTGSTRPGGKLFLYYIKKHKHTEHVMTSEQTYLRYLLPPIWGGGLR